MKLFASFRGVAMLGAGLAALGAAATTHAQNAQNQPQGQPDAAAPMQQMDIPPASDVGPFASTDQLTYRPDGPYGTAAGQQGQEPFVSLYPQGAFPGMPPENMGQPGLMGAPRGVAAPMEPFAAGRGYGVQMGQGFPTQQEMARRELLAERYEPSPGVAGDQAGPFTDQGFAGMPMMGGSGAMSQQQWQRFMQSQMAQQMAQALRNQQIQDQMGAQGMQGGLMAQGQAIPPSGAFIVTPQTAEGGPSVVFVHPPVSASQAQAMARGVQGQAPDAAMGQAPARIVMVAANDLVGRGLIDEDGAPAGEIRYVLMDSETGDVRFAIVGGAGDIDLGGDLVAIPWPWLQIQPGSTGPIRIALGVDALLQAPRLSEQRLDALTSPAVMARIEDYYLDPERRMAGAAPTDEPGRSGLLIGRALVTTLVPPEMVEAGGLRGADVFDPSGAYVGEIERVLIDPDRAKAALVMASSGGFMGAGAGWTPIPYELLDWSRQGFVVQANPAAIAQLPRIPRQQLPARIAVSDVAALYGMLGAQPYWVTEPAGIRGIGGRIMGFGQIGDVPSGGPGPMEPAQAQEFVQEAQGMQGGLTGYQIAQRTLSQDLIGMPVFGFQGQRLGEVTDVVFDPQRGMQRELVIDVVSGAGGKRIAAPLDQARVRATGEGLNIPALTQERIAAAPGFEYRESTVSYLRDLGGDQQAQAGGQGGEQGQ